MIGAQCQREVLCGVVCDCNVFGAQASEARGENTATIKRDIVCEQETLAKHEGDLRGFGARRRTHIQHSVVGLHIKQEWREHANFLLSREHTSTVRRVDEGADAEKFLGLAQRVRRDVESPRECSRVGPGHGLGSFGLPRPPVLQLAVKCRSAIGFPKQNKTDRQWGANASKKGIPLSLA